MKYTFRNLKNTYMYFFVISMLFVLNLNAQKYPFQNPNLSSDERAEDLISRLTLEEKATLMCDQSDAIPRLGIKKFNWWSEALHGYANNDNVTVFPEPVGMAASFDDELVYHIFDAVSDEARAKYNQWINDGNENKRFLSLSVWTPNVNIFRDPRWRRGQETYGEDPYLTSKMGISVVNGLQSPKDAKYRKLLACAKHYAVHSGPEWSRHELNLNDDSPRELYETYLPTFKALVQEADVRQVMCAYQRLDDEPMLWGNYNGTPVRTITILDGIKSKISENNIVYDKACDLVEDKVTTTYIDQTTFKGKKGFKATYRNTPDRTGEIIATTQITNPLKLTTAGQHEFAPGVKLEGFSAKYETSFTAKKSDVLVFKTGATGAFELLVNGKSLSRYVNWRTLPGRIPFKVEAGKTYNIEILFAQSNNWQANLEFDFGKEYDVDFGGLLKKLEGIETVVFVGGLSTLLEGEEMPVNYPGFKGGDRTNIELPSIQKRCLKALKDAGKKVIFVNCSGSAIALLDETKNCDAILQAWYGGESGGQAVADVLFGDYNPSGKLPISFYKDSEKLGDFEDYSMKGRTYRYTTDELFPFGFGLSYTNFNIGNAEFNKTTIKNDESVQLSIPVNNTGDFDGTEIVQVYVRKLNDTEDAPLKTLKGYKRLEVKAGETKNAIIDLPSTAFEFYDWDTLSMNVTAGEYEVYYGTSSDVKDLKMKKINV